LGQISPMASLPSGFVMRGEVSLLAPRSWCNVRSSLIKPAERYRAVDIYHGVVIDVLVIEKSSAVDDHWVCHRENGERVLLPSSAFLKIRPKGE
jgi:hypothetical protein